MSFFEVLFKHDELVAQQQELENYNCTMQLWSINSVVKRVELTSITEIVMC